VSAKAAMRYAGGHRDAGDMDHCLVIPNNLFQQSAIIKAQPDA
jgi:hypothetical protein